MREQFHGELRRLGDLLAGMSETAARQLRLATSALLESDLGTSEQVLAEDAALDRDRDLCLEYAQRLLALQAPVAGDLRTIISAIHCAERIERMGDLARHIAELARRMHPGSAVAPSLRPCFTELGKLATAMADSLTELITNGDSDGYQRMTLADEQVDEVHRTMMAQVTGPDWQDGVAGAINAALLGRFYERFADQVVSVARRLDFAVTGTVVR
jgi:phosphate transport system protein